MCGGKSSRRPRRSTLASDTKHITDFEVVQAILCQCRVKPILELGALPDEHHPRAGQILLIPQFAGWNPDGGQRAISLQTVELTNVEGDRSC
jgi:hypothetical protein